MEGFSRKLWQSVKAEADGAITGLPPGQLSGSDISRAAVSAARTNLATLPGGGNVAITLGDWRQSPGITSSVILTNPPHGIRGSFRAGDVASRYGGEEFAVLMAYSTLADAVAAAERCRSAVNALDLIAGQQSFRVTISFGVAVLLETDTPEDLVARADMALYRAKEQGRNRVASI